MEKSEVSVGKKAMCRIAGHKPDTTSFRCARCGKSALDEYSGLASTWANQSVGKATGDTLTLDKLEEAVAALRVENNTSASRLGELLDVVTSTSVPEDNIIMKAMKNRNSAIIKGVKTK